MDFYVPKSLLGSFDLSRSFENYDDQLELDLSESPMF